MSDTGFTVVHETIRLGSVEGKPRLVVLRTAEPVLVATRVVEAGGRVISSCEDSILVVELPADVTAAEVGADEVQERRLSKMERCVTSTWRPVATAS